MQNQEKEVRRRQSKLLLTIMTLLFLGILGYTIIWQINYYTKYNHFEKVTAEVVDHEIDGEVVYDVLQYNVDGVEYRKITSYISKNEIGDKITIYYDINSPIGVIYSLDYRRYVLPIISAMFGAVCVAFYIIYFISYPKDKKSNKSNLPKTPVEELLQ